MPLRILLCTDGSTFARAATSVAIQLAAAHEDARIDALHVVNVRRSSGNLLKDVKGRLGFEPAVVSPEIEAAHTKHGEDILSAVARDAELAGVPVRTTNDSGSVGDRIAHHARHVDLVVMGLRGTTEDQFPGQGGSHLDEVMSRILVPVLFVARKQDAVKAVALGYDGSDGAARALKATHLLADPLEVPVHAIYVTSDGSGGDILDECADTFPDLDLTRHVVTDHEPHTAMARTAVKAGANVLAVGFRGRSRLKDFLYGTAADYILMNTDLMVLVAH
jgi:nucleotide-binding universal stress UspA family protein